MLVILQNLVKFINAINLIVQNEEKKEAIQNIFSDKPLDNIPEIPSMPIYIEEDKKNIHTYTPHKIDTLFAPADQQVVKEEIFNEMPIKTEEKSSQASIKENKEEIYNLVKKTVTEEIRVQFSNIIIPAIENSFKVIYIN